MGRAQAGLEYLVTYGWALVLIATILGTLVFIIGSPSSTVTFSSSNPTKIAMKAGSFTGTNTEISMMNITGGKIEITSVSTPSSYATCFLNNADVSGISTSSPVAVNSGGEILVECSGVTDASGTISIGYIDYAGLQRSVGITASGTGGTGAPETEESITIIAPDEGDVLTIGNPAMVLWIATGWTGENVNVEYSTNGGESWNPASMVGINCTDESCQGTWIVPASAPAGSNNLMRMTKADDAGVTDTSDGPFTLTLGWAP